VRLEGLGKLKNSIISSGMEPATFRLVAECLNQLHYLVLLIKEYAQELFSKKFQEKWEGHTEVAGRWGEW
jgi:hypothetical protein